jgi:hypothetical protein
MAEQVLRLNQTENGRRKGILFDLAQLRNDGSDKKGATDYTDCADECRPPTRENQSIHRFTAFPATGQNLRNRRNLRLNRTENGLFRLTKGPQLSDFARY